MRNCHSVVDVSACRRAAVGLLVALGAAVAGCSSSAPQMGPLLISSCLVEPTSSLSWTTDARDIECSYGESNDRAYVDLRENGGTITIFLSGTPTDGVYTLVPSNIEELEQATFDGEGTHEEIAFLNADLSFGTAMVTIFRPGDPVPIVDGIGGSLRLATTRPIEDDSSGSSARVQTLDFSGIEWSAHGGGASSIDGPSGHVVFVSQQSVLLPGGPCVSPADGGAVCEGGCSTDDDCACGSPFAVCVNAETYGGRCCLAEGAPCGVEGRNPACCLSYCTPEGRCGYDDRIDDSTCH